LDDDTGPGSIIVPTVHVDQATPPLNSAASSSSSRSSFTDISPPVSPTRSLASSLSPTRSVHGHSLSASSVSSFTAVTESSPLESVYIHTLTSAPKTPPLVLRPRTPLYDSPQTTVPLPNTPSTPTRTFDPLAHPSRKPAETIASNTVQPQHLHNTLSRPPLLGLEMTITSHSHHRSVSADGPQPESKKSRLLGLLRLSSGSRTQHRRVASTSATSSASSTTREPKGVRPSPPGGSTTSGSVVNISASPKIHGRLSDVVSTAVSPKRMATRGPENSSSRMDC
jgi:hypothetical protein